MVSGRDMLPNDARIALARKGERKRERQEEKLAELQHALANILLEHGMLDHEAIQDGVSQLGSRLQSVYDLTPKQLKKAQKSIGIIALALEVQINNTPVADEGGIFDTQHQPPVIISSRKKLTLAELVDLEQGKYREGDVVADDEIIEGDELTSIPAQQEVVKIPEIESDTVTNPEELTQSVKPSPAQVAAIIGSRPKVDKRPEVSEPLSKFDHTRLERLAGPKTDELLQLSSVRDIAYSVWQMMGEPQPRQNQQGYTPDFIKRITQYLEGDSYKKIAAYEHSTEASISQWFVKLAKEIKSRNAGKPQAPSWGGIGQEEATAESELVTPNVTPEKNIDRLSLIEEARHIPRKLSDQDQVEWEQAAVSLIGERMQLAGFTQEDTARLWQRIHLDQRGIYKMPPNSEEVQTLQKLHRYFLDHGDKRLKDNGLVRENAIVGLFLNPLGHYKDIHEVNDKASKLKSNFYTDQLTVEKTQYYAAHGFIKLLEQDGKS